MEENEKSIVVREGGACECPCQGLRQAHASSGLSSAVVVKGCPEERWLTSVALHVGLDVDPARVADGIV
jgi:hypothetical protein